MTVIVPPNTSMRSAQRAADLLSEVRDPGLGLEHEIQGAGAAVRAQGELAGGADRQHVGLLQRHHSRRDSHRERDGRRAAVHQFHGPLARLAHAQRSKRHFLVGRVRHFHLQRRMAVSDVRGDGESRAGDLDGQCGNAPEEGQKDQEFSQEFVSENSCTIELHNPPPPPPPPRKKNKKNKTKQNKKNTHTKISTTINKQANKRGQGEDTNKHLYDVRITRDDADRDSNTTKRSEFL